ncbi:MAG: hypothetical protein P1V20_14805 [Verrucomicrobiales bacterium]|nr:hypothetical protein [Verrucomicrobiales bacterium]
MSEPEDHPHEEIQYRGGKLSDEDQDKIEQEEESHKADVTHVQYRGAEDDVQLHANPEKHSEHIQYRGAEDDVDI